MQVLIKLVLGLVGLVILAVGGLGIYLSMFFDPNEYKGVIEEQARTHAGVDLGIEGDLGWSVFPWLGLEIGRVTVAIPQPEGSDQLAEVNAVQVAVKLMPLLGGAVEVKGVLVEGLRANLQVDAEGRGNWEALAGGGGESTADGSGDAAKPAGPAQLPEISVGRIEIKDGQVRYADAQTKQEITLDKLQLLMKDVTLGKPFPLELAFALALADPQVTVDGKLSAELTADPAQERYSIQGLSFDSTVAGEPIGGRSVPVTLAGNLTADLKKQEALLDAFRIGLDALTAELGVQATGILDQPAVAGRVDIAPFNVKKLLAALGQPPVETTDAAALTRVGAGFDLKFANDVAELGGLRLALDDTTLEGDARVNTVSQAVFFRLAASEINVDRYAPPAADEAGAGDSGGGGATTADAGAELIPVETLRGLDVDGHFRLGRLIASNLTMEDIEIQLLAKKGLVELKKMGGRLYEGTFVSSAKVNVRGKTPLVHVTKNLAGVNIGALLKDLSNEERVAGRIHLTGDFTTRGNTQKAFVSALDGDASMKLEEGEVRGINVSALMCRGLARANQQDVDTSSWPAVTAIDSAAGSMKFVSGVGTNNDLLIETGGARVTGEGTVNLAQETLDYRTQVKVVGKQLGNTTTNEAGEEVFVANTACEVPEKYQAAAVPMRCKGRFSDEPAKLCTLDFAALLKAEAQRRVNEKIDEKVGDKLKEKLGDQMGEDLGNKLKGLFGR